MLVAVHVVSQLVLEMGEPQEIMFGLLWHGGFATYLTFRLYQFRKVQCLPAFVALVSPGSQAPAMRARSLDEPVRQELLTMWAICFDCLLPVDIPFIEQIQEDIFYHLLVVGIRGPEKKVEGDTQILQVLHRLLPVELHQLLGRAPLCLCPHRDGGAVLVRA